jgi:hypothetical protein
VSACTTFIPKNTNTISFNAMQEQYILQEIVNILNNNFTKKNIGFIANDALSKQLEIKLKSNGFNVENPNSSTTNLSYYISNLEDKKIFLKINFGESRAGKIYLIRNNILVPISSTNIGS